MLVKLHKLRRQMEEGPG